MFIFGAFLVAQLGKNLPVNAGDVGSIPGLEDPLEKEMATHTSILAGKSHGQRGSQQKKKKKLETHSQVLPDLLKSYPITESSTKNNLPLIFASTLTRQIDLYQKNCLKHKFICFKAMFVQVMLIHCLLCQLSNIKMECEGVLHKLKSNSKFILPILGRFCR